MNAENPQKAHYEAMHDDYAAHYYDETALSYREKFVLGPLVRDEDLSEKRIADIACGSGHNSQLVRKMFPTAHLEGFDISESACADYTALGNGARAHQVDLTVPFDVEEQFDFGLVVGGLHHCISNLPQAADNLGRMIKSGGSLVLYEPNADFVGEVVRKFWYRRDEYFEADTEGALHSAELASLFSDTFKVRRVFAIGGPAYFVILNSLVLRVPLKSKRYLAPPLFAVERMWNALPSSALKPAFGMILDRR
ncbi:class I SAM-dependent methyltransferase [Paradevosia shaoguanensis]|uniref:Class I SAM-dependent methyltransferase n=1 Tax=Paradevosia shaoguanensis TaxID=1335043 RepID=A0AA41UHP4_9HYPH|nr:class I SAM-dependent methyltransferase [Paradevosia shaoguanensis]MCF1744048.1 class I SAM-dependent methyltransferase [Paradevosia shaoguanensis]MCI0128531.1 class I SAM-dependent methyltransferase [Paradevosia shaoguanensis]